MAGRNTLNLNSRLNKFGNKKFNNISSANVTHSITHNKTPNKLINITSNTVANKGPNIKTMPTDKGHDFYNILIYILIGIIIFIIIVLLVYGFMFMYTDCYNKKTFMDYLIGMDITKPCNDYPNNPINTQNVQNIRDIVRNTANENTSESINDTPKSSDKEEVFHISNQDYTYDQAKCKCNAYGGRLATHSEIIDAYNNGADWCSYGWSEGQTAYYPTQPCTYKDLQKGYTRRHPNNECGRPGVNGGFWDNPYMKFGINCFGVKPAGMVSKIKHKKCSDQKPFCEMDTNYNASHQMSTDKISSFNKDNWNMSN